MSALNKQIWSSMWKVFFFHDKESNMLIFILRYNMLHLLVTLLLLIAIYLLKLFFFHDQKYSKNSNIVK